MRTYFVFVIKKGFNVFLNVIITINNFKICHDSVPKKVFLFPLKTYIFFLQISIPKHLEAFTKYVYRIKNKY